MTSIIVQTENHTCGTNLADGIAGRTLGRIIRQARHLLGAAAQAHGRRLAGDALGVETMQDTGVAPEMATGVHTWQADLPFFMQSGFGK